MSVLYVITGVLMCVWPNISLDLLGKALGVGMLVVGVTDIIIYFTKDHLAGILEMDLTIGVILAAFGAFLLLHGDFVGVALPFGVGILALIGGISKIQYALDMRQLKIRRWRLLVLVAVAMIIMSMLLIYNPFTEKVLIYVMAVILIAEGLLNIFCILVVSHRVKKINRARASEAKEMLSQTTDIEVIEGPAEGKKGPHWS